MTAPPRSKGRPRRTLIAACVVLVLAALATAITYPRWDWRIAGLRETPLSGPWSMPDRQITVMTYNIKFGERLDEALQVVREVQPDVACLQEIKPSQVSYIERKLAMEGYWAPSSNLIGDAAWGNAVFSRGKVDQVQSLRRPDGGAFGVWAVVEIEGGRFIVASVHLMHAKRKDGGIMERIRETDSLLEAYGGLKAPAIIAGDFNEPSWGAVHRLLRQTFVDLGRGGGDTLPAGFPVARVDYIFGSEDWHAVSARTVATAISDHRPVVVVLARKPANSSK